VGERLCASQAEGGTVEAHSLSYHDVEVAVNAAQEGDVVTLPAGQATWRQMLAVAKNITLQGAGPGKTVIFDGVARGRKAGAAIQIKVSQDKLVRVTGLSIKQLADTGTKGSKGVLAVYGGTARTSSPSLPGILTQFRLDHVNIESVGVSVRITNAIGVIDHCTFISKNQFLQVYHPAWNKGDHGNGSWADDASWGSGRFLFVEDCAINYVGPHQVLFGSDGYEGARYVVRHCVFNNAGVTGHGTEGQGRGTKQIEIYNNVFNTDKPHAHFPQLRSGSVLMHDNVLNGYTQGMLFQVYRLFIDKPRWGGADGVNPYDTNATDGPLGDRKSVV
jgi:hypothetical protein